MKLSKNQDVLNRSFNTIVGASWRSVIFDLEMPPSLLLHVGIICQTDLSAFVLPTPGVSGY